MLITVPYWVPTALRVDDTINNKDDDEQSCSHQTRGGSERCTLAASVLTICAQNHANSSQKVVAAGEKLHVMCLHQLNFLLKIKMAVGKTRLVVRVGSQVG